MQMLEATPTSHARSSSTRHVPAADPLALTLAEVTATSRMSRSELYRAMGRGELKAKKVGRRTLILRTDLDQFLAGLPNYRVAA